jgi:hypothetical protein
MLLEHFGLTKKLKKYMKPFKIDWI